MEKGWREKKGRRNVSPGTRGGGTLAKYQEETVLQRESQRKGYWAEGRGWGGVKGKLRLTLIGWCRCSTSFFPCLSFSLISLMIVPGERRGTF